MGFEAQVCVIFLQILQVKEANSEEKIEQNTDVKNDEKNEVETITTESDDEVIPEESQSDIEEFEEHDTNYEDSMGQFNIACPSINDIMQVKPTKSADSKKDKSESPTESLSPIQEISNEN